MKPKGHKRGCQCVICSRPTRKNTRRKRSPAAKARRNAGYERQADVALWNRADRAGRKTNVRHNSTVIIPGTTRSRSAAGELAAHRRRRGNPVDYEAARELRLYIENEGQLYPTVQAIQKSLRTKMARGQYDPNLAVKAFMNLANRGAQMYVREYGATGRHGSYGIFGPEERRAAAAVMADDFFSFAQTGEYDYLLPKKYQNPVSHFPRTTRGPKGNVKWYILDLYDGRGNLVSSRYRKCARAKCATEAAGLVNRKVGKKMVRKVELSGPYGRKPNAKTTRK